MLAAAERPGATRALAGVSFLESSVFPIPPDVMLIPMVLSRPAAWFRLALVCTLASVAGGVAGYIIGVFAYEAVAGPILSLYGYADRVESFRGAFETWGWWIVFGAGLTPFPYKVITIASGLFALNPVVFIVASIVSRGLRFFAVAAILRVAGPPARAILQRHFALLTVLAFIALIGGFLVLKFLI